MHHPSPQRDPESGFTVIEVLISLTLLLIGIVGILTMGVSITRENAFSRHTVEASTLGEDKMEELLTQPTAVLDPSGAGLLFTDTAETINVYGEVAGVDCDPPQTNECDPAALYTRSHQLVWDTTTFGTVTVRIEWSERGQVYSLEFASQRTRL